MKINRKINNNGFIKNLNSKKGIICHISSGEQPNEQEDPPGEKAGLDGSNAINSLVNDIQKDKNNYTVDTESNQAMVSNKDGLRLIQLTATEHKMSSQQALIAIAIICQKGGTSKNANGDIYARVDNIKLTLADLRNLRKNYGLRFTMRQWARTYGTQIYKVCETYSIPGDLAKILARKDNTLSDEDLIWCSNFQMDNINCPETVREKIKEHFDELFNKR